MPENEEKPWSSPADDVPVRYRWYYERFVKEYVDARDKKLLDAVSKGDEKAAAVVAWHKKHVENRSDFVRAIPQLLTALAALISLLIALHIIRL